MSGASLGLVALLAGAAAALMLRPPAAVGSRSPAWRVPRWTLLLVALIPIVFPGKAVVAAVLLGIASFGGVALWRRRCERIEAGRTANRVVEACEQMAAELAAGHPPGPALSQLAAEWPMIEPVAEAQRMGSDVPAAWRKVAEVPGAGSLRVVAAAWQIAHQTGSGLADALDRVALDLRAAAATQRVVDGELGSARSTARLIAGLPVAALAMGSGVGGDPLAFLFGSPVGLACLGLGLLLGWLGLWWIEGLARGVEAA
ncbi:type II secretion system F family protein [Nocardioides sp.]|uniref:type II secretion system F family protein n=1 Tax=Nocardioides sp. TaxID=35761 RepID=UPI001998DF7E|nr:type II secretion system F family protein [Nocardioides sp.]MBC7275453.1 type II secretion system F family protein [Nocardioides sp.]